MSRLLVLVCTAQDKNALYWWRRTLYVAGSVIKHYINEFNNITPLCVRKTQQEINEIENQAVWKGLSGDNPSTCRETNPSEQHERKPQKLLHLFGHHITRHSCRYDHITPYETSLSDQTKCIICKTRDNKLMGTCSSCQTAPHMNHSCRSLDTKASTEKKNFHHSLICQLSTSLMLCFFFSQYAI